MLTRNFVGRYSDEMARHLRFTAVVRISKFRHSVLRSHLQSDTEFSLSASVVE